MIMDIAFGIGIICFCGFLTGGHSLSIIQYDDINDTSSSAECLTTECRIDRLRASLSTLSYMNHSVSPCDNFYKYVCGNYEQASQVHNDKPFSMIEKSSEQIINEKLYDSIEKIDVHTEKFRPRQLVKRFFDMCMDMETRDERAMDSLLEIIKKLRGCTLTEVYGWESQYWSLEGVFKTALRLGVPTDSFLFNIDIESLNAKDSLVLWLKQPDLLTKYNAAQLSNNTEQYKEIFGDHDFMFNLIVNGLDKMPKFVQQELKVVYEFENYLVTQFSSKYKPIPLRMIDMQLKWLSINFSSIFDMSAYGLNTHFDIDKEFLVDNVAYLNFINDNPVPKRVLANYLILKFIQYAAPYLNSEFTQIKNDYEQTQYYSESSTDDRWKACVRSARKSLPHITDAIFIQDHLDTGIRNEIMEMITNIKEEFMNIISSITWWDQSTRNWAIAKLNATKFSVAYPDEAFENEKLDEFYKDYDLVEGDYLKTVLQFNYLLQKKKMADYVASNETSYESLASWLMPEASNDYFSNMIQIFTGHVQDDHYNNNRPKYMNYGIIGNIIGREMIKNFDIFGFLLNEDGSLRSIDDIDETVLLQYSDRIKCLNPHYIRHRNPMIMEQVNPNIADINGIRLSYYAYQQWIKNHGPEPNLPYVPFTPNQMFWISSAHAECSASRFQSDDKHDKNGVRLMRSVSNSPEFAADFKCPINSNMNPKDKCTLF